MDSITESAVLPCSPIGLGGRGTSPLGLGGRGTSPLGLGGRGTSTLGVAAGPAHSARHVSSFPLGNGVVPLGPGNAPSGSATKQAASREPDEDTDCSKGEVASSTTLELFFSTSASSGSWTNPGSLLTRNRAPLTPARLLVLVNFAILLLCSRLDRLPILLQPCANSQPSPTTPATFPLVAPAFRGAVFIAALLGSHLDTTRPCGLVLEVVVVVVPE